MDIVRRDLLRRKDTLGKIGDLEMRQAPNAEDYQKANIEDDSPALGGLYR